MKIKINGARIAKGRVKGNKYITAVINDVATQITFPNNIPVAESQLIVGTLECGQKTYDKNADGTPMKEPFTRWEVASYLSRADQLTIKKMNAEEFQLDNTLKEQYHLTDAQVAELANW